MGSLLFTYYAIGLTAIGVGLSLTSTSGIAAAGAFLSAGLFAIAQAIRERGEAH